MFKLSDKHFFITGIANKKSVAYACAKLLQEGGAQLSFSVQTETQKIFVETEFPNTLIYMLDVGNDQSLKAFAEATSNLPAIDGLLHCLAYANFQNPAPFHETSWENFQEASRISAFSLVELARLLKNKFQPHASVVTVSISNTRATAYGYLGPIKAMLNSLVDYLAKSFSPFSQIRFNAVAAGPLKTSASAGIPNYIDHYLYSEALTLRKKNLSTQEVANTIMFLLSPLSSGINAQIITVDAGMGANYFDEDVVKKFSQI
jgi:enoyl-[acyl-carrier protein] reductase I